MTIGFDLWFFPMSGTGEKLRKSIFGVKMSELNIINLIKQETYLEIFYIVQENDFINYNLLCTYIINYNTYFCNKNENNIKLKPRTNYYTTYFIIFYVQTYSQYSILQNRIDR